MIINKYSKVKKPGVYLIRNTISGKIYIGSSKSIWHRIFGGEQKAHIKALISGTHCNIHLQNAWNKHGSHVFIYEVLEFCSEEELIVREQYYLDTLLKADLYVSSNDKFFLRNGYNLCPIAGFTPRGRKASLKTKNKLSVSKLGYKNPMFGKYGKNNHRSTKIIQYSKEGFFIKVWSSSFEANLELKISRICINSSISKNQMGGGFYWKRYSPNFPMIIAIKKQGPNNKTLKQHG